MYLNNHLKKYRYLKLEYDQGKDQDISVFVLEKLKICV